MSIEMARDALLWCAVINYGVLLVWFLFFILARDFMHRLHGRWFQLSRQQFDIIHYAGMGIFKLGIILFNSSGSPRSESVDFSVTTGSMVGSGHDVPW